MEVLPFKDQFLKLGLSTGANIILNQGHAEVAPLLPKVHRGLMGLESSFGHGCLRKDVVALILILKRCTLVDGGLMFIFDGYYQGLNKEQLTHKVIKNGDGHHW